MASRKKQLSKIIWLSLLGIIAASMLVYYISNHYEKPSFVHYSAFGIDLPSDYLIHGIDVSRHQSTIGWTGVKQMEVDYVKIGFVFIKATEGFGRVDDQFRRNWNGAGKVEIPRGAYHFFISSKSGKAQAQNFISTVKLRPGDLPPVLDVEQTNGASDADLQQRVQDWLDIVERRYNVKPIIYTNASFYDRHLAGKFDGYPLWVAHYLVKDKPRIGRSWSFWQHSETGRVNGIRSLVDFNVFNGDSTAFEMLKVK